MEEDFDEKEDLISSVKSSEEFSSTGDKKHLRKYRDSYLEEENPFLDNYNKYLNNNKKPKKELTEDEILKRNDQILKRKLHAEKMLEEEKRQTIEKILNEDGRKLRERQKKLNEEVAKKEQQAQENFKLSLTRIKCKHSRDGKIYLRFPQGLLLPKILMQKPLTVCKAPIKCGVMNCKNFKKYKDPVTKIDYCSIDCYKILKNTMHIN